MYDYLKVERGVNIDNKRKPMNDKDYQQFFNQVEKVLKNSDWKNQLDDIFGL